MSATPIKTKELPQATQPNAGVQPPRKGAQTPIKTIDTIESINPEPEQSSWKMWLAKLPCIGAFFAWMFGIKIEETEPELRVNQAPKFTTAEIEANNKKACMAPFASANPDALSLTKSKEAFGQLSVRAKLEVLQELQGNANCTHEQLLPLFKLLESVGPKSPLKQLYSYIEAKCPKDDPRNGKEILEVHVKHPIVIEAVGAYISDEKDKADEEMQKKILANYAGPDFPAADVCRSSLDCFKAIEGDKGKLLALQKLMGLDSISDAHVRQFVATLPARPKAPAAKPLLAGAPTEAPAEPQPIELALLRDILFEKLKVILGAAEEQEKLGYKAAQAAHERAKKPFNEPAPIAFDQLEDYFAVRHNNLRIRQAVERVIEERVQEIGS